MQIEKKIEVLISEEEIIARCKQLGQEISKDYQGKGFIMLGLLKGSVQFMSELSKNINNDLVQVEYMDVSSYYDNEVSTGEIKINMDMNISVNDQDILIVEDIVDTGITLDSITKILYSRKAKTVKIATLLNKQSRRIINIKPDYCGFEIPDKFVVGFGLDYKQKIRNLPYVGVMKD